MSEIPEELLWACFAGLDEYADYPHGLVVGSEARLTPQFASDRFYNEPRLVEHRAREGEIIASLRMLRDQPDDVEYEVIGKVERICPSRYPREGGTDVFVDAGLMIRGTYSNTRRIEVHEGDWVRFRTRFDLVSIPEERPDVATRTWRVEAIRDFSGRRVESTFDEASGTFVRAWVGLGLTQE
jgi:hypothetical protein